jgi:nitrate/nitrite transporter NarK
VVQGTFILLTWMPTYYNQVLGLDMMKSGLFSVLPWVTMALSANLGGWIADTLITRGMDITRVRKVMQTVSLSVCLSVHPSACRSSGPPSNLAACYLSVRPFGRLSLCRCFCLPLCCSDQVSRAGIVIDPCVCLPLSVVCPLLQIGFLGPAFFLTQLGSVHSVTGAVACMMASQGLDAFSQSGLYSNHQVGSRNLTPPALGSCCRANHVVDACLLFPSPSAEQ